MFKRLEDAAVKFYDSDLARKLFTNTWYSLATRLDSRGEATFLNYGFAYLDKRHVELAFVDEENRYSVQLYDYVAHGTTLKGKDVLEVGCGKGGGASYVERCLGPARMVAVDICAPEIAFAKKKFGEQKNLKFMVADAHSLPLGDISFDVVLSVETSHHYSDMAKFLSEVQRVLKPGGSFLMACYRNKAGMEMLRQQLTESGLQKVKEEEITKNVLLALDIDAARRAALVHRLSPAILKKLVTEFAGLPGTELYQSFASGEWIYANFVYRKS
jgi:SAM-dependent methyltransferase